MLTTLTITSFSQGQALALWHIETLYRARPDQPETGFGTTEALQPALKRPVQSRVSRSIRAIQIGLAQVFQRQPEHNAAKP